MVASISKVALSEGADVDALAGATFPGADHSVAEEVTKKLPKSAKHEPSSFGSC